jgi:DNA repair protein RecO (recombination protein O)
MPLVTTEAVVLHAFNYLESSRIYRLATRDAGVQSVLAKGARRSRTRYGSAVDLFAQGEVQLYLKPNRELHNLAAFDVTRARPELAEVPGRFTAASAVSELMLRFARDDPSPTLFDALVAALDAIGRAPAGETAGAALAGAWHLVAELGFAPSIDNCGNCHREIAADASAPFSHPAGGVLCGDCSRRSSATRVLPPDARLAVREWMAGRPNPTTDAASCRAHQRLLREFLAEHLTDGRALTAYAVWELNSY